MLTGMDGETEKAVLKWFKNLRDLNLPISGPLLLAKVEPFSTQLCDRKLKCSTDWHDRFKE